MTHQPTQPGANRPPAPPASSPAAPPAGSPAAPAGPPATQPRPPAALPDGRFLEEFESARWILDEVHAGRPLPVTEANAVTHSLFAALQQERPERLPQLEYSETDSSYLAAHAVNVCLLAMSLAEFTGLDERAIREIGIAALLHDVGMSLMPQHLLTKADQLDEDERQLINQHPAVGARVIIEANDPSLDSAVVVAYEHHLRVDGTGYPALRYPRAPHFASQLVQICATFNALRTPRTFRSPWPDEFILSFLVGRAGVEFDTELTGALRRMLEQRQ
jgi:HD-GYP domain-containing protein (c-di-GMP phosphodiesterase class II)